MSLSFMCCVCKLPIAVGSSAGHRLDPCALTLTANHDAAPKARRSQEFWCHAECVRRLIGDRDLYIFDEDHPTQSEIDAERDAGVT